MSGASPAPGQFGGCSRQVLVEPQRRDGKVLQLHARSGVYHLMARDPDDDALALRALQQFQSAQPDAAIVVATVTEGETDDSQIVAMRLSHHSPLHLIAAAQALLHNAMDELTQSGAPNSDAVPRLQSALAALAQSAWPLQPQCVRSLRRQGKPLRR